ncbi:MAG: hypothetical protein MI744_00995, partial [Pseudomonadales bacterium]|nr:hypothetical protein [Pseudomonadales bacterium]
MNLPFAPKSFAALLVMAMTLAHAPVFAQESFRVELGRDGETLGDMRPVFLEFGRRPLPAISSLEVARRY